MKVETALMAMQENSLQAASDRHRDYMEQIQPWIRRRAAMWPAEGFSFKLRPDGSFEDRIDHWSAAQLEQLALIDREIALIGQRFGLSAAGDDK